MDKGIYPVRENTAAGVDDNSLFVARCDGRIAGSVILDHQPEKAYENIVWKIDADYSYIFCGTPLLLYIHLFANGSWTCIDGFFTGVGFKNQEMKSIRLDVYEKNLQLLRCTKNVVRSILTLWT